MTTKKRHNIKDMPTSCLDCGGKLKKVFLLDKKGKKIDEVFTCKDCDAEHRFYDPEYDKYLFHLGITDIEDLERVERRGAKVLTDLESDEDEDIVE